MFCYQCEQTFFGRACTGGGVCGKDTPTAILQDLLVHVTKGVSMVAHRARAAGIVDAEADTFVIGALFSTVTNVNFDFARVREWVRMGLRLRKRLIAGCREAAAAAGEPEPVFGGPAAYKPPQSLGGLIDDVTIVAERERLGPELSARVELCVYGLKGAAAYVEHARRLGHEDAELYARFHEALAFLGAEEEFSAEALWSRCLEAGRINHRAMELLDTANTETFGHPEPTAVRITPVAGKAIVVSGHDLLDLARLLEQTAGKGVNIYTHGEMLPAHGYPELKKHPHLVGHFGGAWQEQVFEFPQFPGAILMTTNCIQEPQGSYAERIFTTGLVAWPEVTHVGATGATPTDADAAAAAEAAEPDFSRLLEVALESPGFPKTAPEKTITVGFGHQAVLAHAGAIVEAVKSGALRRFFLVGGCDGAKPGRDYFTAFTEAVPDDCAILTLACGKFRFHRRDFGEVGGLPRLLDLGQCNDAYSALVIATALAEAFECGINQLPLSMILSWYEQKAVAILLTLLSLGVKNIRLGPSLPSFVTPQLLAQLHEEYNLMPTREAKADLAACFA